MTLTPDTLTVALGDRAYDIFFGRDIYPLFQEWICRFYPGGTVHVVTDRNVASIYGADIRRWLSGIPHGVLELPPGEESKSFDTVREIYSFLARGDAGRDSLVVAFGGGVVGDLAGFAAATYLRGISYIQVPTTLLSQVDSSVGGKTGFNLPEGKNLVGAFHQPRAVFVDDAFLLTLDERNLKAGMAEVVKSALAGDAELWSRLVARGGRWKSFAGEEWRWIVRRAVAFKASVVERDEREASLRRILNLGHTVGHAMEKAGGYGRLLHGEAVAAGLAWEAVLGRILGATPGSFAEEIVSLLLDMGYDLDDPGLPLSSIAAAIGMDKKRILADVDLPLVAAPGRCELRRVPLPEIRRQLPAIRAELRERTTRHETRPAPEFPEAVLPPETSGEELSSLERRVAGNPRDPGALTALAAGYRRAGKLAAAWEAIQAVLEENPADAAAQRVAAELGRALPAPETGGGSRTPPPSRGWSCWGTMRTRSAPRRCRFPSRAGRGNPRAIPGSGTLPARRKTRPPGPGRLRRNPRSLRKAPRLPIAKRLRSPPRCRRSPWPKCTGRRGSGRRRTGLSAKSCDGIPETPARWRGRPHAGKIPSRRRSGSSSGRLRRSTGMTFRDVIEGMHRKDPGVKAGALVGGDGLTVEEWHAPADACDLQALCAEIVRLFRESDRIAGENGLGGAEEISLAGERALVFLRRVTEEYFLLVVATPGTVPGKCRFLLRQAARRTQEML